MKARLAKKEKNTLIRQVILEILLNKNDILHTFVL
jgi:hypothetical protein